MRMLSTPKPLAVVVCIIAATVAVFAQVSFAPVLRSGAISKFDGADAIIEGSTNGTSYTTVPGMTRTFTVSGTTNSPVLVLFQGSLSLGTEHQFDTGFLRLTIDGVQQSPGEIPAIGIGERGTHGFTWQTGALTPNVTHTARVQWRTDLGSTFTVDARSVMVLHK